MYVNNSISIEHVTKQLCNLNCAKQNYFKVITLYYETKWVPIDICIICTVTKINELLDFNRSMIHIYDLIQEYQIRFVYFVQGIQKIIEA